MTAIKVVKKVVSLCIALGVLEVAGYLYGLRPTDIISSYFYFNDKVSNFEDTYNIQIRKELTLSNYPKSWLDNKKFNDQTIILPVEDNHDLIRFVRSISNEIKKYPQLVITRNINSIYLLDSIQIEGTSMGGTYSADDKSIYITNRNSRIRLRTSLNFLKRAFHHELSSVLIENNQFDHELWRKAAGKDFHYKIDKDPTYAWMHLHGHTDPIDKETLLNRGLLRQYAETGVENDFNIYAETIFTQPRKMKKLITKYPVIKRKYELFKDFYLSIDEGFTPVFEKIDS